MPEGHTTHALAARLNHAFAGWPVAVSSPQGRFAGGAALLDGLTLVDASAWGKHLFAEFEGERWLNVHLGLIGKFSVMLRLDGQVPIEGQVRLPAGPDRVRGGHPGDGPPDPGPTRPRPSAARG